MSREIERVKMLFFEKPIQKHMKTFRNVEIVDVMGGVEWVVHTYTHAGTHARTDIGRDMGVTQIVIDVNMYSSE